MIFPENRLIAALQKRDEVQSLLDSPVELVFLRVGDVETLRNSVRLLHNGGKRLYVQVDLIRGLSAEREAVTFVVRQVQPDGIVTTRQQLVRRAQELGLPSVLHSFVIDSGVFATAVEHVRAIRPDAFYLMPGVMPRVVRDFKAAIDVPLIVGGLFKHREELEEARRAGADAVVSGSPDLWGGVVG